MKVYLFSFVFFMLAFAGLAAGLLLNRKGISGGCSPASSTDRDCRCEKEAASNGQVKVPGECKPKDGCCELPATKIES